MDHAMSQTFDRRSSYQLLLLPYRKTSEKSATPNAITRLPLEIQYIIFDFVIGDAKGKMSCEEVFGHNTPKGVNYLFEANAHYHSHTSRTPMLRKIYLKYHLPASASPQFMLTSYDLYKVLNPLYRALCHAHVEASWRDLHRLADIVPGFAAHFLREAYMIINDKDFDDWGSIAYFHPDIKSYPNLKELTIIHTNRYGISKFVEK